MPDSEPPVIKVLSRWLGIRNIQLLINGKKSRDWKTKKNLKAFINYLQTIDDGFGNLEDYIIQQRKKVVDSDWWNDRRYGS